MKQQRYHRLSSCLTKTTRFPTVAALSCILWFAPAPAWSEPGSDQAELQYALALATDQDGTIYVADRHLPGIWKIADGQASVYFQGSKQFRTPLNAVRCLAIDNDGHLLAGDSATREVYRFDENQQPIPLTDGLTGIPMGIAVNKAGDIFVSDLEIHRIWKIPAAGGEPEMFAQVPAPTGLAVDEQDRLWIVSRGKEPLVRLSAEGEQEVVVSGRPFEFPHQVVILSDGSARVTDGYGKTVWKVIEGKAPEKFASSELFSNPVGLARRGPSDGGLLVADPRAESQILTVDAEGEVQPLQFNYAQ